MAGVRGVGLDFFADRGHVAVDGACGDVAADAPDVAQELLAVDGAAFVLDEIPEDLEFKPREGKLFAAALRRAVAEVDLDVATRPIGPETIPA